MLIFNDGVKYPILEVALIPKPTKIIKYLKVSAF